jgi:TPR repeat protein
MIPPCSSAGGCNISVGLSPLGEMLCNGEDVAPDKVDAVRWWLLAAAQALAGAHSSLGKFVARIKI